MGLFPVDDRPGGPRHEIIEATCETPMVLAVALRGCGRERLRIRRVLRSDGSRNIRSCCSSRAASWAYPHNAYHNAVKTTLLPALFAADHSATAAYHNAVKATLLPALFAADHSATAAYHNAVKATLLPALFAADHSATDDHSASDDHSATDDHSASDDHSATDDHSASDDHSATDYRDMPLRRQLAVV